MALIEQIQGMLCFLPISDAQRYGGSNQGRPSCRERPLRITADSGSGRGKDDKSGSDEAQYARPCTALPGLLEFHMSFRVIEEDLAYLPWRNLVYGRIFFVFKMRATKGPVHHQLLLGGGGQGEENNKEREEVTTIHYPRRLATSSQFTTDHQLVMYSARLFWYFR